MNSFAHILSGLKGTIATPWRSFARLPALFLLWLQLKRLTTALDALFTAWREGTLPIQPAIPTATPAPTAPTAAPRPPRKSAPRRVTPRTRIARLAQPRVAHRPRVAAVPQALIIPRSIAPRGHGRAPRHLTHHRR